MLVTGAGGLVGTATCRRLVAAGVMVRALVGPPGRPGLPALPALPETESRWADVTDLAECRRAVVDAGAVVHLAGPPSVAASFRSPVEYARSHVVGTATLLEACRDTGVRRMVYISSAEIYGCPQRSPVSEEAPAAPRSPYAAAKLGAEAMVTTLAPALGLPAAVLRPFSVYGAGSPPTSLVGRLVRQVLAEPEVHLGDLRPVRDYLYVDDLADAVVRALTAPLPAAVRAYNAGSGVGTSVGELAAAALAAARRRAPVRQAPGHDRAAGVDIPELVADTARASAELGWAATTPLDIGLRAVCEAHLTAGRATAASPGSGAGP